MNTRSRSALAALAALAATALAVGNVRPSSAQTTVPGTETRGSGSTVHTIKAGPGIPARTVAELLALGRPLVLAHTGGEDAYPGSTMFGFVESAKAGVDLLDLNVQLSRDGVLVVHHDDSTERTTDFTGKVAEMTVAQLAKLDNAYWFTEECGVCHDQPQSAYRWRGVRTGAKPPPPGYTAEDFAIPTLASVLERFPKVPLGIEIKGKGKPAADAARVLARQLTEAGMLDRVVVSAFDDETLQRFRREAPTVEVSPSLAMSTAWVTARTPLPKGIRILQLPPEYEIAKGQPKFPVITPELIRDSHAKGYLIWVWPNDRTMENLDSYRKFLVEGLDGLNINFPAAGVQAVEEATRTRVALSSTPGSTG